VPKLEAAQVGPFTGLTRLHPEGVQAISQGRLTECKNCFARHGLLWRTSPYLDMGIDDFYNASPNWSNQFPLEPVMGMAYVNHSTDDNYRKSYVFTQYILRWSNFSAGFAIPAVPTWYNPIRQMVGIYRKGTANATPDTTITFPATAELTQMAQANDYFRFPNSTDKAWKRISSVDSDTQITLADAWSGSESLPYTDDAQIQIQFRDSANTDSDRYPLGHPGTAFHRFTAIPISGYAPGWGAAKTCARWNSTLIITEDNPPMWWQNSTYVGGVGIQADNPRFETEFGWARKVPSWDWGQVNGFDGVDFSLEGARTGLFYHGLLVLFGTKEFSFYDTGNITAAGGSTVVTGAVGTQWGPNVTAGDQFYLTSGNSGTNSKIYEINTVDSNTQLTLTQSLPAYDATNEYQVSAGSHTYVIKQRVRHRSRIRWSNFNALWSVNDLRWTSAADVTGYSDDLKDMGDVIDAVELNDVIYIFCEHGIATLRYAAGMYSPFSLRKLYDIDLYPNQRVVKIRGDIYFFTKTGFAVLRSGVTLQRLKIADRDGWDGILSHNTGSTYVRGAIDDQIRPPLPPKYGIWSAYDTARDMCYFMFYGVEPEYVGGSWNYERPYQILMGYIPSENSWFEMTTPFSVAGASGADNISYFGSCSRVVTYSGGFDYEFRDSVVIAAEDKSAINRQFLHVVNPLDIATYGDLFDSYATWKDAELETPWLGANDLRNHTLGRIRTIHVPVDISAVKQIETQLVTRGADGTESTWTDVDGSTQWFKFNHSYGPFKKDTWIFKLKFRDTTSNMWYGWGGLMLDLFAHEQKDK